MSRQRREKDKVLPPVDVTITIGPDGRVLLGELTVEFLPVAEAICPDDPQLARRREIAQGMRRR